MSSYSLLDSLVVHDYESEEEQRIRLYIKPEYRSNDSCDACDETARFMVETPYDDSLHAHINSHWGFACNKHLEQLEYRLALTLAENTCDSCPQCETCGSLTDKHYSEYCTK